MSKSNEDFQATVNSLFKGMDSFLSTKTVLGEAITIGDTVLLPLVSVSFGVGAGVFQGEKNNNGAGGLGGKMTPTAILVIHDGTTRLINIANHSGMDKVLDMLPDFVDGFKHKKDATDEEEKQARKDAEEDLKQQMEK